MSGAARVRRPLHGPGVVELAAGSILARGELVVALLLVGGAWTTLVILEATRVAPTLHHHALIETGPPPWVAIPLFLGAWQVMVAAMMVPASLPAIDYVTRAATARVASGRAELTFLAGFFLVWAAFGLGAFLGDMVVHRIVDSTPWLASRPWLVEAGVLALAGGYQFMPRKHRDLERRRRPGDHMATTGGPQGGAARLGLDHGIACVGASWALMLLMFGEGFGSLIWMGALTGVMILETYLPSPRRLSSAVGVGLILLALLTLSGPFV